MNNENRKIRLGILLSGGGRTMVNLAEAMARGALEAEIAVVVSSRTAVGGVERARGLGFEPHIIRVKDHPNLAEFSTRIEAVLEEAQVDLVLLCGWLCRWQIPLQYENKVMNIHPALLPSFGGKGMWGRHVHEGVLRRGCKVSGCTVHFVTNAYDAGPIILQRVCVVEEGDDAETLAARVFEQECAAYPEAVRLFAEGRLEVKDGRVHIK